MTSPPAKTWPKPYLLKCYEQAMEQGCIRIKLENADAARSFTQAFYRLRRRSDKQHAAFIRAEYHMVFTHWEPERSSLLIIYDKMPDGAELPEIEAVEEAERIAVVQSRAQAPAWDEQEFEAASSAEVDLDKLMTDLLAEAGQAIEGGKNDQAAE